MPKFIIPNNYAKLYLENATPSVAIKIQQVIEGLLNTSSETVRLKAKTFMGKKVYTLKVMKSHRLIFEKINNRSLSKLAEESKVPGNVARRTAVYTSVHEDSSTTLTKQFASSVEFGDRPHGDYLLRGIALNHDYNKALNWQPIQELTESDETLVETESDSDEFYFDREWLEPTLVQNSFLCSEINYPHLVVGAPGAGKTFLALSVMQKLARKHQQTGQALLKILYITSQENLLREIKKNWVVWEKTELNINNQSVYAVFMTYETLLAENYTAPTTTILSEEELLNIIQSYIQRQTKTATGATDTISCNKQEVLQEILICAHHLAQDKEAHKPFKNSAYHTQHSKHSPISSLVSQEFIYDTYFCIMDKLTRENKKFPGLSAATTLPSQDFKYDLICADEAQSVPIHALMNLIDFAKEGRVLYFGDSNQRAEKTISSLAQLGGAIFAKSPGIFLAHTELPGTQRLKAAIAKLCNEILLLQHNLLGGLPDSTSYSQITSNEHHENVGSVTWVSNCSNYSLLESDAKSAGIVLLPHDAQEAQQNLGKTLIFTVEEVRGLQFEKVFIYLSEQTLQEFLPVCSNMITKNITSDSVLKPLLRSSPDKSAKNRDEFYSPLLSSLMVALSRAQSDVFIYCSAQEPARQSKLRLFLNWLEHRCNKDTVTLIEPKVSSIEDWITAINTYINKNLISHATKALMNHCSLTQDEAHDYVTFYQIQNPMHLKICINKILSYRNPLNSEVVGWALAQHILESEQIHNKTENHALCEGRGSSAQSITIDARKTPPPNESPAWMQNYWLTTDASIVVNAVLAESDPGKWLFQKTTVLETKSSVFEWIFNDKKRIIQISVMLNDQTKQEIWNRSVQQYIHRNTFSNPEVTNFEHMLLSLHCNFNVNFNIKQPNRFPPAYDITIINAVNTIKETSLLGRKLTSDGLSILFILLAQENKMLHDHATKLKKIDLNDLGRIVTSGLYQGANIALLTMIRERTDPNYLSQGSAELLTSACSEHPTYKDISTLFLLCVNNDINFPLHILSNMILKVPIKTLTRLVVGTFVSYQNPSIISLLLFKYPGILLLKQHNNLFRQIDAHAFKQCIRNKPILHWLYENETCHELLLQKWDIFKRLMDDNDFIHEYFLNFLFATSAGEKLLKKDLTFFNNIFESYIKTNVFQPKLMYKQAGKAMPLLCYLCTNTDGVNLLKIHWGFFTENLCFLNINRLWRNEPKKILCATPIHCLCNTNEGVLLLKEKWDFFKNQIDAELVNSVFLMNDVNGNIQIISSFFRTLIATDTGIQLLQDKWLFFKDLITKDSLLLSFWDKAPSTLQILCLGLRNTEGIASQHSFFKPLKTKITAAFFTKHIIALATLKNWSDILLELQSFPSTKKIVHDMITPL